ncbi:hypothetical protein EDB86DRAFT_3070927 [Lactarius hatsudake]|nr:hypothetical protein EDB86DRAFT_3070927 [Lactarius hatsudake]
MPRRSLPRHPFSPVSPALAVLTPDTCTMPPNALVSEALPELAFRRIARTSVDNHECLSSSKTPLEFARIVALVVGFGGGYVLLCVIVSRFFLFSPSVFLASSLPFTWISHPFPLSLFAPPYRTSFIPSNTLPILLYPYHFL